MALYKGKTDYSAAETRAFLAEVMDNKRVLLSCEKHSYVASETPPEPRGCKDCAQAYWWHKIASTPPHLRAERLQEALRVVRAAVESFEKGEFDFIVDEHPIISIEKDAS